MPHLRAADAVGRLHRCRRGDAACAACGLGSRTRLQHLQIQLRPLISDKKLWRVQLMMLQLQRRFYRTSSVYGASL